jgi:septum formation topological specificity factor MinE
LAPPIVAYAMRFVGRISPVTVLDVWEVIMALKATATTDSTTATQLRDDVLNHLTELLQAEGQRLRVKRRKKTSDHVTEARIVLLREELEFWTYLIVDGKPGVASAEADDTEEWTDEELAEPPPFAEAPAVPAPPVAPAAPEPPVYGGLPSRSAAAAPQID